MLLLSLVPGHVRRASEILARHRGIHVVLDPQLPPRYIARLYDHARVVLLRATATEDQQARALTRILGHYGLDHSTPARPRLQLVPAPRTEEVP